MEISKKPAWIMVALLDCRHALSSSEFILREPWSVVASEPVYTYLSEYLEPADTEPFV
jgi:hypothetical protein